MNRLEIVYGPPSPVASVSLLPSNSPVYATPLVEPIGSQPEPLFQ